jgi:pimeloyl-ACP methyl ester carboxylesterase
MMLAAKGILVIFLFAVLSSCVPPAKVPLDTITYPQAEGSLQECLVIFLPGRGGRAAEFEREGFIERVRQSGLKADVVAAELHIGYYVNWTAVERLRHDVIAPARALGYRQVWLVGISMGGLGALEYAIKYPDDVTGIVLLSPYLGDDGIINEIIQAGDLKDWEPGPIAELDYQRHLWAWIRDFKIQGLSRPVIYLGYGSDDRFIEADHLLALVIGPHRTMTVPGGHTWTTWKVLWNSLTGRISCSGNMQYNDGR